MSVELLARLRDRRRPTRACEPGRPESGDVQLDASDQPNGMASGAVSPCVSTVSAASA